MEYKKNYENFGNKKYGYNRDNFRIRSPVKTFRDLEVYQVTIKLSNLLANLDFLKDEKDEIKQISEKIPKLIAESYGDKFDSFEIAEEKLNETMTLITFEGAPEEEFFATKVLDALEMGFSFSDATSIKENELEFDVINIKEFVRRGNLEKIRGRLIGKDGRVLKALSELTKCSLEMKGNEIGIIGDSENIKPAIDAIIQIIQGSKHANVYKGLEKRKEDPLLDLGLKEKKK